MLHYIDRIASYSIETHHSTQSSHRSNRHIRNRHTIQSHLIIYLIFTRNHESTKIHTKMPSATPLRAMIRTAARSMVEPHPFGRYPVKTAAHSWRAGDLGKRVVRTSAVYVFFLFSTFSTTSIIGTPNPAQYPNTWTSIKQHHIPLLCPRFLSLLNRPSSILHPLFSTSTSYPAHSHMHYKSNDVHSFFPFYVTILGWPLAASTIYNGRM